MTRKLIEVSHEVDEGFSRLAKIRGESKSHLIDSVLKQYIDDEGDAVITDPVERAAILEAAAGMWKDRTDLPDFAALRGE
jgi:predicted transcriptional regulator